MSRGIFVLTFLDDAMELTTTVQAMRDGDVEPTRVVQNALEVLAQVIVAAVSVDEWTSSDLFDLVRRAYPYHTLTRGAFDEVLAMLRDETTGTDGRLAAVRREVADCRDAITLDPNGSSDGRRTGAVDDAGVRDQNARACGHRSRALRAGG